MTTKTVDEWAAEQCGVEIMNPAFAIHREGKQPEVHDYPWIIKDPRCREIFRLDWLSKGAMRQVCFTDRSVLYVDCDLDDMNDYRKAYALYDEGGEQSCITAIYEASQ